ncbi:MAG: sigma-70 family RNA polymerase sigma factor [Gemmataceae bacterium]|nr:sigma-70 family RNA polymerase sigma factor [Gemmataceae bacterium]
MNVTAHESSLERLLDGLRRGDVAAAEQLFIAFEPYLRLLVRRQLSTELQAKFDSVDVVQSVWADLIDGFRDAHWQFPDVPHLRAFLLKATQNRFIDNVRKHRHAAEREQPLADTPGSDQPVAESPSPPDEAHAADVWDKLLTLCPPQHRELLDLKRQGFSLAEIAAHTGLHESSVRRILYELARKFAVSGAAES